MRQIEYVRSSLLITPLDSNSLLSGNLDSEIKSRMEEVIKTESPILESLLYKRVLNSFDLFKLGSRLSIKFKNISSTLTSPFIIKEEGKEKVFFYLSTSFDYFRATPDSEIRYSYQIPVEEGANAILYILETDSEYLGKKVISKKKLIRSFASVFSYSKLGSQIKILFNLSLKDERFKEMKIKFK